MKNFFTSFENLVQAAAVRKDLESAIGQLDEQRDKIVFAAILALIASVSGGEGARAEDVARGDSALAMLRGICDTPDMEFGAGVVMLCRTFERSMSAEPQDGSAKPSPRLV